MLSYYRSKLTNLLNNGEYNKAFEYLIQLVPNLSLIELNELSNYYMNFMYLKNIRSKL